MTDPRFAAGGLIDSGVDGEHPPPWLDGGCTYYVPERDGPVVTHAQARKYLPLLEMINRSVHPVRPLVNERDAAILRAHGAPEDTFDVSPPVPR
jgi:hypothetical protein